MNYTCNPSLSYIDLPFEWIGTPVDHKGRFVNHEFPFVESFSELIKWQTSRNPQKKEKKNDPWKLDVMHDGDFLNTTADCIVWLGHASFFIRISGVSMLIDPVFFNLSVIKRKSPLPVPAASFRNINYFLISHDHRDHCDQKSIHLLAQNNPEATWLTGLNLTPILRNLTQSTKIQEACWYQQFDIDTKIKITYVPSRHWGRRFLKDTNLRLWGGFVMQCNEKTIYFAGDSGYGSHFADIAKVFPGIDYCMIGIGAYKPEFFMGQSHTSPRDAVKAFKDCHAQSMIPMHYGTFDLADEPIGDPLRVLAHTAAKEIESGKIKPLAVGEILRI